jgi:hypothetical protein
MANSKTRMTVEVRRRNRLTGATIDDRIASLMESLDHSWFRTKTRARIPDGDRIEAKHRRIARGVRLAVYWYHRTRRNVSGKPARRYGIWCTPRKTNKYGTADWFPDRDYDTGRRGWSYEEAGQRSREAARGACGFYWRYEVRELPQSEWKMRRRERGGQ